MKVYKSKTYMSIYVVLKGGKGKHLRFDPMSDGCGLLRVTNKEVMQAVEAHEEFGKAFVLWRNSEMNEEERQEALKKAVEMPVEEACKPAANAAGTEAEEPAANATGTMAGEKKMVFACFDDAREWANEELGILKKKMMSKTSLINACAERGFEVVIGE